MSQPSKPTDELAHKWGATAILAGWGGLPNVLFNNAAELKLKSIDVHIICVINTHWWTYANKPFLSNGAIAEAVGVKDNTVRRRIQRMEKLGYIKRVAMHSRTYKNPNQFLLDGLVAALQPFAAQEMNRRSVERQIRALRGKPKRPQRYALKPVN